LEGFKSGALMRGGPKESSSIDLRDNNLQLKNEDIDQSKEEHLQEKDIIDNGHLTSTNDISFQKRKEIVTLQPPFIRISCLQFIQLHLKLIMGEMTKGGQTLKNQRAKLSRKSNQMTLHPRRGKG
jgi:hypothetical protein